MININIKELESAIVAIGDDCPHLKAYLITQVNDMKKLNMDETILVDHANHFPFIYTIDNKDIRQYLMNNGIDGNRDNTDLLINVFTDCVPEMERNLEEMTEDYITGTIISLSESGAFTPSDY
jgi:hypothetical protein